MATYTENKKAGTWRAQVQVGGHRRSATLPSKPEARAWAARAEAEILSGKQGSIPDKTFGDLLTRYRDEVTPQKRGQRWETTRLNRLLRDDRLAQVRLRDLDGTHVAAWRDRRLQAVSAGAVLREWNLLSAACNHARTEWKWIQVSPFSEVKRPRAPAHRDRRISEAELGQLQAAVAVNPWRTYWPRVLRAARWAIETGMRAGEVVGLTWDKVDLGKRVARLDRGILVNGRQIYATKNGKKRDVPLSGEAVRIAREAIVPDTSSVFCLTSQQRDTNWRDLCAAAGIQDLHFHDTRHEAITRLSQKLDVLELARMVGVTDLKILMVYFNKGAEDIALKL